MRQEFRPTDSIGASKQRHRMQGKSSGACNVVRLRLPTREVEQQPPSLVTRPPLDPG
jgi:hypothetical protein